MLSTPAANRGEVGLVTFGPVHLGVIDAERPVTWWGDVVGLQVIVNHGDSVKLGVDGTTPVALRAGARRGARRGCSGLDYLAICLPDEPAFTQTLARLLATRSVWH
jgi:catechol-2,3-dioxygenase